MKLKDLHLVLKILGKNITEIRVKKEEIDREIKRFEEFNVDKVTGEYNSDNVYSSVYESNLNHWDSLNDALKLKEIELANLVASITSSKNAEKEKMKTFNITYKLIVPTFAQIVNYLIKELKYKVEEVISGETGIDLQAIFFRVDGDANFAVYASVVNNLEGLTNLYKELARRGNTDVEAIGDSIQSYRD